MKRTIGLLILVLASTHIAMATPSTLMEVAMVDDPQAAAAAQRDLAAQEARLPASSPVQVDATPGGAAVAVDANPGSWKEFASQHWGKALSGVIVAAGTTWYLVDRNSSKSSAAERPATPAGAQAPQTGNGNVTVNNTGPGTVVVEYQSPHNNGE